MFWGEIACAQAFCDELQVLGEEKELTFIRPHQEPANGKECNMCAILHAFFFGGLSLEFWLFFF